MDLEALVARVVAPLRRKVESMVVRGVVAIANDALKAQGVQVTLGVGDIRDSERFQDYGFTSAPLPGAECIAVAVGGDASHPIILRIEDRRFRLTGLLSGEVAMYDNQGQKILLGQGNTVRVETLGTVTVVAPKVELGGAALAPTKGVVQGDCIDTFTGLSFAALGQTSTKVLAEK